MSDFEHQLFLFVPLGLGLIGIGLTWILLSRKSRTARIMISGAVLATAMLCPWLISDNTDWLAAAIGSLSLSALILLIPQRFSSRSIFSVLRPMTLGLVISTLGASLVIGSVLYYEIAFSNQVEREQRDMELLGYLPKREVNLSSMGVTDRGRTLTLYRPVEAKPFPVVQEMEQRCLKLLNVPPAYEHVQGADENTNCHGWVFTGGKAILSEVEVQMVLDDNGYQIVDAPQPGDVVIYRNFGKITHTAVVHSANAGQPIEVISKWSWMSVYRHAVDGSIYGKDFQYYRSPRADHRVGIANTSAVIYGGAE